MRNIINHGEITRSTPTADRDNNKRYLKKKKIPYVQYRIINVNNTILYYYNINYKYCNYTDLHIFARITTTSWQSTIIRQYPLCWSL